MPKHPICAPISGSGAAAIAIIRCSGEGVIPLVARHFRPAKRLQSAPSHSIVFGTFFNAQAQPLDEILISVYRAPNSYTGEDVLELSCHGNPDIVDKILSTLLEDMSLAQPGEFTLRAYLNSKLDLAQAEAVNDLITSASSKAETAALMQLKGYLSRHLEELLERISDARLRCELAIDFADQDLPNIDEAALLQDLESLLSDARALYTEGQYSRKIREGIRICLAGAPNAGKSSLFNAFLQQNRAIVSPTPGTTRDYLEESLSLKGYTVVLYDTAGLRESHEAIEKEGISRTRELMQNADYILYLYEASPEQIEALSPDLAAKCLYVASKSDLRQHETLPAGHIPLSVISSGGLNALTNAILERLKLPNDILYRPLVTNARHLAALKRSIDALESALISLEGSSGWEYIAFDLSEASRALEDILGVLSSDELLNQIFSNFCIGK